MMATEWNCWNCGYHYDQAKEPPREQFTTGVVPDPDSPPPIPCIRCPKCGVCMGCRELGERRPFGVALEAGGKDDLVRVALLPALVQFGEPATATSKAIANTTFSLDEVQAVYRDMMAKANELRAREKETLARLTVGFQGQPIEPIVTELERMGFKVYVNIDYDPPCSENAIVLLASEGKLVRFHSVHWGLSNV